MRCARATRHFIAETVTQQRSGGLAGHAHAAKGQVMCDMSESGLRSHTWTEMREGESVSFVDVSVTPTKFDPRKALEGRLMAVRLPEPTAAWLTSHAHLGGRRSHPRRS